MVRNYSITVSASQESPFKIYIYNTILTLLMHILTKSKYIIGLECPKYLWMVFNAKDQIPEFSADVKMRMAQGTQVGALAKNLYPDGADIAEDDFKANLERTKLLLKERKILFEAGIQVDNLYARADILIPIGEDKWNIVEVKSSTKVKDDHIDDVSFQKYVYQRAGLKIRGCYVLHLNSAYERSGKIDPQKIFEEEEITEEVNKAMDGIEERIATMQTIIALPKPPEFAYDAHQYKSEKCVVARCYAFLPQNNVFALYRGGKKAVELAKNNVLLLTDIPDTVKLTAKQVIQRKCARTKKPHIDTPQIVQFLSTLETPLSYLDFETFQTALPLYDNLKPWQQVPFQYSLHIEGGENIMHHEFIHDEQTDPRKAFLDALMKDLPNKGSIIVYNKSFEERRLQELAALFPQHNSWIANVVDRLVDLIIPFRNFHYYTPKQKGSCSIKDVLPALTGNGYSDLEISSGSAASAMYTQFMLGDMSKAELDNATPDLLKYCKLDTEGMIWILDILKEAV